VVAGEDLIGYNVTTLDTGEELLSDLMTKEFREAEILSMMFCVILLLFSGYFFFNEARQMVDNGELDYLS